MANGYQYLQTLTRSCALGQVIERLLQREAGAQVGKIITHEVAKGSRLQRKIPGLFEGLKNPQIQYGYENTRDLNSFFLNILDGRNVKRAIKYNKANGIYNAEIRGTQEHLNCVFNPDEPLLNLSKSALKINTGVKGTPENMVDMLVNLNDSALRIEGRVAKARLGRTLNRCLPSKGRIGIQSGVEGTPAGRTDIGINYHDSDVNLELQNKHLQKLKNLLSNS
ncbi:hypothetical protein J6E39_03740 [bacterium]|nr:hypothetical protein [bacterium]